MNKKYEQLLAEITGLYKQAEERRIQKEKQGEFFNVFNTIGLRTEEVRLHSAMIAELLNPNGMHGLSNSFLQAFLERFGLPSNYVKGAKGKITERDIGRKTKTEGGRIDIIIEDGKHAIIIENKIYAEDQKNQLLRYYNYGKKQFTDGFELVYLTLEGDEPEKKSLGGESIPFKPMSYKKGVVEWLDDCINIADEKPLIKAVVIQYKELIKQITNTDMETKYKNQLIDTMVRPDNAIVMSELLAIEEEWFSQIMDNYIWVPLKEYAASKNMIIKIKEYQGELGAWIYKEEWRYCGISVRTINKRYWTGLFYDISYYETPSRSCRIIKEKRKKLDCFENEPDKDSPYGWEFLLPKDIQNWNSSITKKIVTKDVANKIIQKFDQILNEIEEKNILMV
jgi:hypothetical protein